MSNNGVTNMKQMMVVVSTVEEWSSFKSLLKKSTRDKRDQLSFSSMGSSQVCDFTVDGRLLSFHYAELKQSMTEEAAGQAVEACFKSCSEGIRSFLLLIQGGNYTQLERQMVEILKVHFGAEALKYLVVLSLEDGKVVDMLDDALVELINICNGRYCRITSSAGRDTLLSLFEMVDLMLAENGVTGYTENMLDEANKTNTEGSAMKILKEKAQEAEEKERVFKQLLLQHEERRAKEMETLRAKHNEERRKEAEAQRQYEAKRESLEEAVVSHRAMVQIQMKATDDDDTNKMSVILLGLSGSGKSSALNVILNRAGNQYSSVNESSHEPPQPTETCQKKEVFAAGKRLVLVDTPELWDEDGFENLDLVKECLALSLPGPHAFLLVLQVGRFTQGECEMLGMFQQIFGREFAEYAIVLFVRFDANQHKPQRINDYVSGAHTTLRDMIQKCGCRYYELNIAKSQNALSFPQVKDLLSGINKLVAAHGGHSYAARRFSVQELQDRRKAIEDGQEGGLEVNYLLRDA